MITFDDLDSPIVSKEIQELFDKNPAYEKYELQLRKWLKEAYA